MPRRHDIVIGPLLFRRLCDTISRPRPDSGERLRRSRSSLPESVVQERGLDRPQCDKAEPPGPDHGLSNNNQAGGPWRDRMPHQHWFAPEDRLNRRATADR